MNQEQQSLQILQMYQQLQAQAQSQGRAQLHAQSAAQSAARPATTPSIVMNNPSHSPNIQNTVVVPIPHVSVSPTNSIRSNASIHLGELQVDPNGNQGMNI